MFTLTGKVYCLTCRAYKRSFKTCCINCHRLIYDMDAHASAINSAISELTPGKTWFDHHVYNIEHPTDINTFVPSYDSCSKLCPIHNKKSVGFCMTCMRNICFTANAHVGHKIYFRSLYDEFSVDEERVGNLESCMYENFALRTALHTLKSKRDANEQLQYEVINILASYIPRANSFKLKANIIECMYTLSESFDELFNNDLKQLEEDVHMSDIDVRNASVASILEPMHETEVEPIITDLNTNITPRLRNVYGIKHMYVYMNRYFTIYPDHPNKYIIVYDRDSGAIEALEDVNSYIYRDTIESIKGTFLCIRKKRDFHHRNFNIETYFFWNNSFTSREDNMYVKTDPVTNELELYWNERFPDDVYFIDIDDKLLHVNRLIPHQYNEIELPPVIINYPFIRVYNSDIRLMFTDCNNDIWYYTPDKGWKKMVRTLANFMTGINTYIGSWLRHNEPEYGMFISDRMMVVYNEPMTIINDKFIPLGKFTLLAYSKNGFKTIVHIF